MLKSYVIETSMFDDNFLKSSSGQIDAVDEVTKRSNTKHDNQQHVNVDKTQTFKIPENTAELKVTNLNQVPPPLYTIHSQQQIPVCVSQRQRGELDRWERDLDQGEAQFESVLNQQGANNWPKIPSWCHRDLKPCFYHDIDVEIKGQYQILIKRLYRLWTAHVILLFVNLLVASFYVFVGGDRGETFGLALIYWMLFTPLSFLCWFRPAYKAFRDNSSLNFMLFFFVFFFQFLTSVVCALGIGGTGSSGLIKGISLIAQGCNKGSVFVGVCMLFTGIAFAVCAAFDYHLLVKIHKIYRNTGGKLTKAQTEFTSGVMDNDAARRSLEAVAKEVIVNPTNNQTSSTEGNQKPSRY